MSNKLVPPHGYTTWLDFAVETFDTRGLVIESLLRDDQLHQDRTAIREAARQELRDLRLKAMRPVG